MDDEGNVKRHSLLTLNNIQFEVANWAPSQAVVDLSIACMFELEVPGSLLTGGLMQLNQALGGALTELRDKGLFKAQGMETLLLRPMSNLVHANAILIVGLGNPLTFSTALLERCLRVAFREAVRFGALTVAFAPNLMDAGQTNLAPLHVEAAMVRGILGAYNAELRLVELGLAPRPALHNWAFDTGSITFDSAVENFLRAFNQSAERNPCKSTMLSFTPSSDLDLTIHGVCVN